MSRPESEDRTGDVRPVSPGAKALGAMELAARRAREAKEGVTATHDPPTPSAPARAGAEDPLESEREAQVACGNRTITTVPPERWLAVAVGVAALLVVVAAIALVISLSSNSNAGPVAAPPAGHATTHTNGTGGATASHAAAPSSAPAVGQTTSTLPSLGTPGGAPVISSLSPSSGSGGQTIQVAGSNFLSSDGQIVATFAGQVAPTSCPSQTTCTVTVPSLSAPPGPVPVTITTSAGASNAVTFAYG
jgi:hypothetical protein